MSEEMISYCGLICTQCPAYQATQANDVEKAKETAEMWARDYNTKVSVEDVWCDGCLVEGKKCAHCSQCQIRACARTKAVVNCAACDDYACEMLSGFFKMAPMAKETLERIRNA